MKRLLTLVVFAVMLGGCAVPATNTDGTAKTAAQKLQTLADTVNKNCQIGQPFIKSMLAVQTDPGAVQIMTTIDGKATQICGIAATIANPPFGTTVTPTLDIAAIKDFANTEVPKLLTLVVNSNLSQAQKTAAELAITGAQLALNQAAVNAQ